MPGAGRMGSSGRMLAVGNPSLRPTSRPCTTVPARAKARPSMALARGRSPAATAARIRVLETGAPPCSTWGMICAAMRAAAARSGSVAALPARSLPKVKLPPTTISASAGNSNFRSARNASGLMAANSRVKGSVWISAMPQAAICAWFCSGVPSRRGARAGLRSWATCGWNVRQPARPPRLRAAAVAARKTAWWPRCTPSNWPMASTSGGVPLGTMMEEGMGGNIARFRAGAKGGAGAG